MTDTFKRALLAADFILKGENFVISSEELETSMLALAESRREPGESGPQAFARLARDRNSDVAKLFAAMDVRRVAERHAQVLAKRADAGNVSKAAHDYARAQSNLDEFVKQNQQAGESVENATARLARGDAKFASLYAALTECRRLAAG